MAILFACESFIWLWFQNLILKMSLVHPWKLTYLLSKTVLNLNNGQTKNLLIFLFFFLCIFQQFSLFFADDENGHLCILLTLWAILIFGIFFFSCDLIDMGIHSPIIQINLPKWRNNQNMLPNRSQVKKVWNRDVTPSLVMHGSLGYILILYTLLIFFENLCDF